MKKPVIIISAVLLLAHATAGESLVFPPFLHSYGIRKATPGHLFMFFGPQTRFDDPQGLAVTRLKTWDNPSTDEDDDEVTVYGVNSGRGEIIYNKSMWALGRFGKKGKGKGCFSFPRGIAADEKGNVFVADSGNDRIVRLFNPKSRLEWKGAFTGASREDKGLKGPAQVGIDEEVNVYAADPGNRRIIVFDSAGRVLRKIPGPGSAWKFVDGPTALAVADGRARWSYFRGEKHFYCADKRGTRLWKIGLDGTLQAMSEMPAGHAAAYGATDYFHNFWITDAKRHCVVKYDRRLKLLDIFGSFGEGDNQFVEPRGITIYKRYGQTFIAEKTGAQYFWVGTHLKKAEIEKRGDGKYRIMIKATEYSMATLFSAVGGDTVTYFKRKWVPCDSAAIIFSVKNGKMIRENGLTIRIEPSYSSFSYNEWCSPIKVNNAR
ncbi:MAG: hypothetical protein JXA71_17610 [Chitinispirillaceae bacterium]|nr:hypothetical protein [Chitinispirillaceae bacterium]